MEQSKNALPAILLKNVKFGWDNKPLLNIGDFRVERGEHLFLYGASGSGKTSLLNLLVGINIPQQGDVQILGQSLTGLSQRQRDKFRAQHMGIIFQQFNLITYLSVLDNLLLRAEFAIQNKHNAKQQAIGLLSFLGLSELLHQKAQHLSVGQQQRVAIARALINSPDIIIADEPTSALDSDNRDAFIELLFASARTVNATVVFVSHDKTLSRFFSRSLDMRTLTAEPIQEAVQC
jgi:putative ABC transport system ATP-binding protein